MKNVTFYVSLGLELFELAEGLEYQHPCPNNHGKA